MGLGSVAKGSDREGVGDIAEAVQVSTDGVQESRRVGVFGVLDLELFGDTASGLLSKNLLSLDPAVIVLTVIPTLDNLQTSIVDLTKKN